MDPIDYWRFCTEYSVVQAALLIVGSDPSELQYSVENSDKIQPVGYVAVRTALVNAVRTGRFEDVTIVESSDFGRTAIDVHDTIISGWELDGFVKSRGYICDFFARGGAEDRAVDPGGPYFSKKLDAANKAWATVTSDPTRLAGKSPKQALKVWLTENAAELGLLNKDGTPNTTGIEEICKVANWKPEGGATPTPTLSLRAAPTGLTPLPAAKSDPAGPRETFSADLDDEIPF